MMRLNGAAGSLLAFTLSAAMARVNKAETSPSETVEALRIVHQDAVARLLVRHPVEHHVGIVPG
jgi:hypothetical protein